MLKQKIIDRAAGREFPRTKDIAPPPRFNFLISMKIVFLLFSYAGTGFGHITCAERSV